MGLYFDRPYRASLKTVGWDIPVRGRVVDVQTRAIEMRGWVQVWFEYKLDDGRTGRGLLKPLGHRTSAVDALESAGSYRIGSRVDGFANPDDPTEAVIMVGKPRPWWRRWILMSGVGGVALLFGFGVRAVRVWWARRRRTLAA